VTGVQTCALPIFKKEAKKNKWIIETEERMSDGTIKVEFVKY
jgi:hypothetical protein